MDLRMEMRWYVRPNGNLRLDGTEVVQETERVLQYRTQSNVIDYSSSDHIKIAKWAEWQDVPEQTAD
jgi:hypothetical protein